MENLKISESLALQDERRMQSLQDFINEFEEPIGRKLTGSQTTVLIKLAKELISSIEKEITVATLLLHQLENKLS
jgi:hypothetical protein